MLNNVKILYMPLFKRYFKWSYVLLCFVLVALLVSVFYFFSKVLIVYPVQCVEGNYNESMKCSTKNERVLSMILFILDKKNNKIIMQYRGRNFVKIKEHTFTGCTIKNIKNWKCPGYDIVNGNFLKVSNPEIKYITNLKIILSYFLNFGYHND